MARHAGRVGAGQVVIPVHVALYALQRGMRAGQGKASGRVIERGIPPRGRGMALLASLREVGLHVIGIGGALEILQVARHASRVRAGQVVVVVHVTLRALRRCMSARQGETGGRVVEVRSRPGGCVVALLAILREAARNVIRIRGPLVIVQMAGHATRVRAVQRVVVVDVALRALQGRMRAGQRESGSRVIEGRSIPGRRIVALRAGLREIRLHVIRLGRTLEILQVAGHAGRAGQIVVAVHVTLRALNGGVRAGERESGVVVIEGRRRPRGRVVALLASLRESAGNVIRVGRALKILQVAADTSRVRARQVEVPIDVALRTLNGGMRSGQREARGRVIKVGAHPRGRVVALRTGLREAGLHVVGIGGALEVLQVAGHASRIRVRQVVVVVDMALRTLDRGVRSRQRKTGGRVVETRSRP